MTAIAIITARGGSKRIPRKNIKNFCGKPIIAYSIEAAIESGCFSEVMVSTEDTEIAKIAKYYGAKVPFLRSLKNSTDYATTADVVAEVLDSYKKMGITFDRFACVYPTAPFVTSQKIREAMSVLEEKQADAIISVVKYGFPPQRAFVIKEGSVAYQYPEYASLRSQDLEPIYHDCGQFYICSSDCFSVHRSMILPYTVPYIVPEEEVQDIDTISDWIIAEAKYNSVMNDKD